MGHRVLAEKKNAFQVKVLGLIPQLLGHLHHRRIFGESAGAVDENVDSAIPIRHLPDGGCNLIFIRDVTLNGH